MGFFIIDIILRQLKNTLSNLPKIICHINGPKIPSIKFNRARAVADSRQFSAYEVGLLND